jgi:hypothetical protein
VRTPAEFRGTLELLGYTPERERAAPGEEIGIRYFWKVKRDPGEKRAIGVFVHVEGRERRRFQSDHPLLEGEEAVWPLAGDDIVVRETRIRIPRDAAPGTYRMLLGVYDLDTGKRWRVSAGGTAGQRERVPLGTLQVEAAEAR